jgi:CDP-diacylglycerol--glycerol-3-phosphate 3-phosphatidyltransferase
MGINVSRMSIIAFGLGSALAATAGALIAPTYYIFPQVGSAFTLKAFVITVLGGMGSVVGATLGGVLIGVAESIGGVYFGSGWKEVVVFVLFLLAGGTGWRIAAFAVFLIASVTDLLDGRIARQRGLITDFGKIADPIADKALTGAALVTLSAQGALAWWVTAVILAREVGVTGLRFWVIRHGVIAASRGGKIKTLLQVLAIALYVLPGPPGIVRTVVMGLAVVVTVVTGADYIVRAVRLRRRSMSAAAR